MKLITVDVIRNVGRLCAMPWLKHRRLWKRKYHIWHGYERRRLSLTLCYIFMW